MLPLIIIFAALIAGFGATALILFLRMRSLDPPPVTVAPSLPPSIRTRFLFWPDRWLLIRTDEMSAVQKALQLHHPEPCSWVEGLAQDEKLFIAPAEDGWVMAVGAGLPDPNDDVDVCFRFILGLARRFEEIQYFTVNRVLYHHAWVKARWGQIVRAYAWAGSTVWNQGALTHEERELKMKCYDYGDVCPDPFLTPHSPVETNVEKTPLLATRWSVNLIQIYEHLAEQKRGVRGDLS